MPVASTIDSGLDYHPFGGIVVLAAEVGISSLKISTCIKTLDNTDANRMIPLPLMAVLSCISSRLSSASSIPHHYSLFLLSLFTSMDPSDIHCTRLGPPESHTRRPSLLPLLPVLDSLCHAPLVPALILQEFVDSLVRVRGTYRLLSPAARIIASSHPYLVAKEPPSTPFVHPLQPKAGSLHTQISGGVRFQRSFFA
jgi:hypothetical protein